MVVRSSLLAALLLVACGSPGGDDGGTDFPPGADGGVPGDPDPVASPFRYGLNLGHRNASWGDDKEAMLGAAAGARSLRVKLPAAHLKTWGYDIEQGDVATYASLGLTDHIGFLIGSETVGQSTAPDGAEDWQNEYYIPKNLYAPIFDDGGAINPDNYWAAYIYGVVSHYKDHIKLWHIWNEPDWVADWHVVETWTSEPPTKAQLPRFNGSIYDYVRMLRVAKVAARAADPDALIATGGIGYPAFLDAVLRYTDNPDGGAVTAEFPETGAAYVDVVDFHYYPIFGGGSSDAGVDGFIALQQQFADVVAARGAHVRGWNNSENGAPLAPSDDFPQLGSPEYARNYLIKLMVEAQVHGVGGVDWFILSRGSGGDAFSQMGLYEDVAQLATPDEAVKTDLGVAYTTLTAQLAGATYDAAATAALALPDGVRGAAFLAGGKRHLVLWATTGASETASSSVSLSSSAGFDVVGWNGDSVTDLAAGTVQLAVTGSPIFATER
jgi:hypothetical protein